MHGRDARIWEREREGWVLFDKLTSVVGARRKRPDSFARGPGIRDSRVFSPRPKSLCSTDSGLNCKGSAFAQANSARTVTV